MTQQVTDPVVGVTTYMEQSLAPAFQTWAQQALTALREGGTAHTTDRPAVAIEANSDGESSFEPLTSRQALERFPSAWDNPFWSDDQSDLERAVWLLRDLGHGGTRTVIAELVSRGRVRSDELSEAAGYSPRGLPPALKHIATRCRQVARRPMWDFERDADGYGIYWMEDPARAVFAKALEALQ